MTAFPFAFPDFADRDADPLCAEIDGDLFYPEPGGSNRAAKAICGRCELEDECLKWALVNRERFGVWGGKSEAERRHILSAAGRAARRHRGINHGTEGGYRAHQRHGEPVPESDPCGCLSANRLANQERQKKRDAA